MTSLGHVGTRRWKSCWSITLDQEQNQQCKNISIFSQSLQCSYLILKSDTNIAMTKSEVIFQASHWSKYLFGKAKFNQTNQSYIKLVKLVKSTRLLEKLTSSRPVSKLILVLESGRWSMSPGRWFRMLIGPCRWARTFVPDRVVFVGGEGGDLPRHCFMTSPALVGH